jgi:hypothetical protein
MLTPRMVNGDESESGRIRNKFNSRGVGIHFVNNSDPDVRYMTE